MSQSEDGSSPKDPLDGAEWEIENPAIPLPDTEPVYRLADGPTRPLVEEEIKLMDRLAQEIDSRLPPDLSEEERDARALELIEADPRLGALAERLHGLSESHDQSVLLGLAKLAEEEAEERNNE